MFLPLAIVAILGLAVGALLAYISPEELKKGEKYFCFLRKLILTAIIVTFALNSAGKWQYILVGLVIGFFLRFNYLYLGLAMAVSTGSTLLAVATLTFIYGIPTGTLLMHKHLFRPIIILITLAAFFLPLPLNLFQVSSPIIMSFCLGALVHPVYSRFMQGRFHSLSI